MKRYKITNTETGEVVEKEAEYLGTAIEETGWPEDSCQCEILSATVEKPKKRGRPKKNQEPDIVPGETLTAGPNDTIAPIEPEPFAQGQPIQNMDDDGPLAPEVAEKLRETAELDQEAAAANYAEKLEKEINTMDIHQISKDASPQEKEAWEHKQRIEAMAVEAEVMFLMMGQLLYDARVNGEWSVLRYDSYKEYVEDLKLPMTNSYSWATRLSNIYEYMAKNMGLDKKMLAEIGVAKLTRLLPLARKNELTEEVLEAARTLSDLDLRAELGHSVGGGGDGGEMWVICPRCGERLNAKTATRGD